MCSLTASRISDVYPGYLFAIACLLFFRVLHVVFYCSLCSGRSFVSCIIGSYHLMYS